MRRAVLALVLAVTVLLSGCASITWEDNDTTTPPGDTGPDPPEDVIGWENGYWHNASILIDQSDGLTEGELDAYVSRAMARVEVLRNREFKQDVPVTVISRDEYQSGGGREPPQPYRAWNNQVWEGLFIVGEDTDFTDALSSTRGSAVSGFYSPSRDEITIITPTPDEPTISNTTLIHELVHALQDQYIDLNAAKFGGQTQDGQLAGNAVIEGEANYIETLYTQRCGGMWSCVPTPDRGDGGGGVPDSFNFGVFLTIFHPYSDGPVWVARQIDAGGWPAFTDHYDNVPVATEQIIHRTTDSPVPIEYTHKAVNGWEPFPQQGVDGADTVGEASIFAMFWYQSRNYDAGVINWRTISAVDSPFDTYNYSSPPSAGWGNDLLVPYRKETGDTVAYGYVWKTVWDTERDASQFVRAYRQVLAAHDASQAGPGTWVIPSGPYADAFRVIQDGTTVLIVNGPTVDDLDDIRSDMVPTTTATTTEGTTTTEDGPGFGIVLALVAVAVAVLGAARRRA